jgi:hypothetical protein
LVAFHPAQHDRSFASMASGISKISEILSFRLQVSAYSGQAFVERL